MMIKENVLVTNVIMNASNDRREVVMDKVVVIVATYDYAGHLRLVEVEKVCSDCRDGKGG